MEGAGSRTVPAVVLMVVCGAAILRPHRALGQQLPCEENERKHRDCCPCQDVSLVCLTECPESHYQILPPLVNVCPDTSDSNASTTPSSTLVHCSACHETCKSCRGGGPGDCEVCAKEHQFQEVNRTMQCLPQNSSSDPDVGAIVGGTLAAVVVVVVAVLLLVWIYRYRRWRNMEPEHRRSISTLMGPRTKAASPAVGNVGPQTEEESVERAVEKEKAKRKIGSPRESVYENVEASVPKVEAIQQGHDNITRYSRDPTIKEGQGQSKKAGTGLSEDEEVKNLPRAPAPPGATPLSPPQDTYEIVETPAPRPTPKAKPTPQLKSSPGAQAAPSQSYEIMDFSVSLNTARSSDAQAGKGSVTVLKTGPAGKEKRRTFMEASTTSSLPNPKASTSCPALPKFPSEEHEETQVRQHESQSRLKYPSSSARTVREEPEDDYENAPSKKKADTKKRELSDPGEDCQTTGPKEKLMPQVPDQERGSGLVNPALDEPQEVYGNQDVVDDHTRYSNTPITPPQGTGGTDDSSQTINRKETNDASDQPTYGNDVSDEDGHDYQNCPRPRSKP